MNKKDYLSVCASTPLPIHSLDKHTKKTRMDPQVIYHLEHFPVGFLLKRFFPRIYGSVDAARIELPLERRCRPDDEGCVEFWRNYELSTENPERDLRERIRQWQCVKVHAGLPLRRHHLIEDGGDGKPFVLDIDLTEETYREGLGCDCKRSVCAQCWIHLEIAMEVIRYLLKQVMGVTDIKVFFSGSRGIHVWVIAPCWSQPVRELICARFVAIGDPTLAYWHPRISAHIHDDILVPAWNEHFVGPLPDKKTLFKRLYPVIDVDVTVQSKHAIGCPLSTHKRTGNVIAPIPSSEFRPVHCSQVTHELMKEWIQYMEA